MKTKNEAIFGDCSEELKRCSEEILQLWKWDSIWFLSSWIFSLHWFLRYNDKKLPQQNWARAIFLWKLWTMWVSRVLHSYWLETNRMQRTQEKKERLLSETDSTPVRACGPTTGPTLQTRWVTATGVDLCKMKKGASWALKRGGCWTNR